MEKMRQWTLLTAVAVVAVLAGGWFLLVSPQKSHVASLRTQTAAQQSTNNSLAARVQQLEQQKKGQPAEQQLLNRLITKLPDNPELPTLIRQLSAAAQASGVDLVSLAPSPPTAVTTTAPTAVTPPATTDTTATGAAPTTTGTTVTPAAPPPPSLEQIQLSITVTGSYFNIESFFRSTETLSRAMLVSQWTMAPVSSAASAPSTTPGGGTSSSSSQQLPPDTLQGVLTADVFESPTTTPAAAVSAAPVAAPAQ